MRAAIAAVLALTLTACAATAPAPRADRTAPVVRPDGYTDNPQTAPKTCDTEPTSFDPRTGPLDGAGLPTGAKVDLIRKRGELVIGVSQTAPFFSVRDLVTGRLHGFEVDIAQRIALALWPDYTPGDRRLQLVTLPTGDRLYALETKENTEVRRVEPARNEIPVTDMVIADVSVTCARENKYGQRYTVPYLNTVSGLLVRSGLTGVAKPSDLRGRRVCSGAGTTNSNEMIGLRDRQRAEGGQPIVPIAVADTSECLMMLQRGQADAIYTDVLILEGYHQQDPATTVLDYHDTDDGQGLGRAGIAMSADHTDLIRFVNTVLGAMSADGSLQRSYDQWFRDVPERHRLPLLPYPYK